MRPKPHGSAGGPLVPGAVAIVLSGWTAKPPGVSDADNDSGFEMFMAGSSGVIRAWREHEGFLRGEARRLGIEPQERVGGRLCYFGEYLSLLETARAQRREELRRAHGDDE